MSRSVASYVALWTVGGIAVLVAVLFGALYASRPQPGPPPAPPPPRDQVTVRSPEVWDTDSSLHIWRKYGEFKLRRPAKSVWLKADLYRRGARQDTLAAQWPDNPAQPLEGKFSVQVVDLDYLHLGDGPRGYYRIRLDGVIRLEASANATSVAYATQVKDVPKRVFDLSGHNGLGSGPFDHTDADAADVPLCFAVAGRSGDQRHALIADFVRASPEADILVVYLHLVRPQA